MQTLRLSAADAEKLKGANRDAVLAGFKKVILKRARDMSRRHRGELVQIVGPDDEVLESVQAAKAQR